MWIPVSTIEMSMLDSSQNINSELNQDRIHWKREFTSLELRLEWPVIWIPSSKSKPYSYDSSRKTHSEMNNHIAGKRESTSLELWLVCTGIWIPFSKTITCDQIYWCILKMYSNDLSSISMINILKISYTWENRC